MILIDDDSIKSKTISERLSKLVKDLVKIQRNKRMFLVNNNSRSDKELQLIHQLVLIKTNILLCFLFVNLI
jgi:CO dehydrogenase nickel-insertion accessory protein CooC1